MFSQFAFMLVTELVNLVVKMENLNNSNLLYIVLMLV